MVFNCVANERMLYYVSACVLYFKNLEKVLKTDTKLSLEVGDLGENILPYLRSGWPETGHPASWQEAQEGSLWSRSVQSAGRLQATPFWREAVPREALQVLLHGWSEPRAQAGWEPRPACWLLPSW